MSEIETVVITQTENQLIINETVNGVTVSSIGVQGPQGIQGAKGDKGDKGDIGESMIVFARSGNVILTIGQLRYRFPFNATIEGVSAAVGVPPTGAPIIFDVNKNGTTIFTNQANRPTIQIGADALDEVTNMDISTISEGDYITVDIDQIGSDVVGANLSIFIRYNRV